jgi:membrane-bound lytic murein transglycosylase MltF
VETFPKNVEIEVHSFMKKYPVFLFVLLLSCGNFPDDPDKTLEKITNGTLKVGYSENTPWVFKNNHEAGGIEALLIKDFAFNYNANIEWINGSEEKLIQKLENKEIDIVIAGFTSKTPWQKKKIGITRPYITEAGKKHVICLKQGENRFQVALEEFLYKQKQNGRVLK